MRPILFVLPPWAIITLSVVFALWCLWSAWSATRRREGEDGEVDRSGAYQVAAFGVAQLTVCIALYFKGVGLLTDGMKIYSYGTCLMLGFGSAIALGAFLAHRNGLDPNHMVDLGLISIVSAILGSRIYYYVLQYKEQFADKSFVEFFRIDKGGMSVIGGVIAASIFCSAYIFYKKISWIGYADAAAPAIPLGQGFGRLGCYLNGCCWGRPCGEDSGVASLFGGACHFPKIVDDGGITGSFAFKQHVDLHLIDATADQAAAVHPSQLYSSLASFALMLLLLLAYSRRTRGGVIFCLYAVLYPIQRFTVEFFRGDRLELSDAGEALRAAGGHGEPLVQHLVRPDANVLGVGLTVFQASMVVVWPFMLAFFVWVWSRKLPLPTMVEEKPGTGGEEIPEKLDGGDRTASP